MGFDCAQRLSKFMDEVAHNGSCLVGSGVLLCARKSLVLEQRRWTASLNLGGGFDYIAVHDFRRVNSTKFSE